MCTAVYIGKKVSADGHTIIARSCDMSAYKNTISTILCNKRVENVPGRSNQSIESKIKYEYPDTTYKCLTAPVVPIIEVGTLTSVGLNEYGFVADGTITAYTSPEIQKADPFLEGGICEETLPDFLGKTCKTPKEAIDTIEKIAAEQGIYSANSLIVADQKEAWLIELYSGHQWAAIKLPEDKVAGYGNMFVIHTEYELDNPNNFRHSKDLFNMPKHAGLDINYDGKMSLADTYTGKNRLFDYSNLRTYMCHYLLNKNITGEYDTQTRYPLFFEPEHKVTLKEVFEIYRNRYEGTPFDVEVTKSDTTRLIGTEAQFNVHAIQILDDEKPEMSSVLWITFGNCEHSVFLPYSNLVSEVNDEFSGFEKMRKNVETGMYPKDQEGYPNLYSDNIAQVCFKRLNLIAEHDRKIYGPNIRKFWSNKEEKLINEFPSVIKKASDLANQDLKDAIKYINEYTKQLQSESLAEAKSMFDELIWYITGHIETLRHKAIFAEIRFDDDEMPRPVFEPTLCFKDKYLTKEN